MGALESIVNDSKNLDEQYIKKQIKMDSTRDETHENFARIDTFSRNYYK